MTISRALLCCSVFLMTGLPMLAATDKPAPVAAPSYSSSADPAGDVLPVAPSAHMLRMQATSAAINDGWTNSRPFSAFAISAKVGIGGIGFDIATPLSKRLNLRGGAQFFSYSLSTSSDGIDFDGHLKENSGDIMLDYYPFHGTFRLSPGIIVYNGDHIVANANVPGGGTFTLDDTDYTSSPNDPVHGSATVDFGNKVAPAFTVGWGNMLPRHGGHWSVPFEIGVEYITPPKLVLNLAGTACQAGQGCGNVQTDPDIQENLREEQTDLNNDLSPLRVFPIVSVGISYAFGRR